MEVQLLQVELDQLCLGNKALKQLPLDDFEAVRVLGQGQFSTTYLVRRRETGELLCNKQIPVDA